MKARDFPTPARLILCVVLLAHAALSYPQEPCGARLRHSRQCDFPIDFLCQCQQRNPRSIEITEIRDQTKIVLQHTDNYRKAFLCIDDGITIESAYQTAKSTIPDNWKHARSGNRDETIKMLRELKEYVANVNSTNDYVKYTMCVIKTRIDTVLQIPQNHTKSSRQGPRLSIKEEFNMTDTSKTQERRQLEMIFALFDTLYRRLDFVDRTEYKAENALSMTKHTVPKFFRTVEHITLNEVIPRMQELRDYIRTADYDSEYDRYSLFEMRSQINATVSILPRSNTPDHHTFTNSLQMEFDISHTNSTTRTVRQRQVIFTIFETFYKRLAHIFKDLRKGNNKTMKMLTTFRENSLAPIKALRRWRHLTLKKYKCVYSRQTIENYAQCYRSLQQELRDYRNMTDAKDNKDKENKDIKFYLKKFMHHINKYVKTLELYVPSKPFDAPIKDKLKERRKKAKSKSKLKKRQFIAYFFSRYEELTNQFAKVLEQTKQRKWTN